MECRPKGTPLAWTQKLSLREEYRRQLTKMGDKAPVDPSKLGDVCTGLCMHAHAHARPSIESHDV